MTWVTILIDYINNNILHNCPKCGDKLKVEENEKSITFFCDNCKSFHHFDGIRTKSENDTQDNTVGG